jgi:Holliday junction resolvase RusA-like endonuclease
MSTTITVPLVPPSPNVLRRQYRHPQAYKRLRETWEHSLAYAVPSATVRCHLLRQASKTRVRVKITVFHSSQYDPDNLTACCKPVLDALRNIGYIHDDAEEWLELAAPQQRSGKNTLERKTVVEIEGV